MAWWTGQPVYGSNPVSKFIRENFAYLKQYVDYIVNSGVTTADLAAVHASPPTLAAVVNITVNTTIGATEVGLGGGYNISGGVVLTINGAFSAPLTQIFFGAGTVVFAAGSVPGVYPEWWGTTASKVNAALVAAKSVPVRITNSLTAEVTIKVGSNQTLLIDDAATLTAVLTLATPMIQNLDTVGGNSNIVIKGGNFNGLGSTQTVSKAVINFTAVTNGLIEDVKITNSGSSGVDIPGAISIDDSYHIDIIRPRIINIKNYNGILITGGGYNKIDGAYVENDSGIPGNSHITVNTSPSSKVLNSTIINSNGSHISFNSVYGLVSGNTCLAGADSSLGIGIVIGHDTAAHAASWTIATENTVLNMANGGITLSGDNTIEASAIGNTIIGTTAATDTGAGISTEALRSSLVGNLIRSCNNGISVSQYSAPHGSTVTGNTVINSQGAGIIISHDNNTISGNTVINSGVEGVVTAGIYLGASANSNVIVGNNCYDNQTPHTQVSGIEVLGTGNLIVNNMVGGNLTYGVNAVTGNVVKGNMMDSVVVQSFPIAVLPNDATPSVLNGDTFVTGGTTAITDFDYGIPGQTITIIAAHTVEVSNTSNILLAGAADYNMTPNDTLTLIMKDDGNWNEVSRSVN